jgi:hypothetical protein
MTARPRLPLLDVSLLLALISALLVTAGWAYAQSWYAQFDLGLRALEVPPVDFGIYGFKTLAAHWWWLLPLGLGAAVGWGLIPPRWRRWAWLTLPPLVLLLFWGAYRLGGAVARADYQAHAKTRFCAYPYVRVALDPDLKLPDPFKPVLAAAAAEKLRLLVQTPNLLVLIDPEPGSPPLLVPMAQVRMLRVIPVQAQCRP